MKKAPSSCPLFGDKKSNDDDAKTSRPDTRSLLARVTREDA